MNTVSSVIAAYLKFLDRQVAKGSSAEHVSRVSRDLERFADFVGREIDVTECRQYHLSDWLTANPQWLSVCTQNNAVASVIGCFRWAEDDDRIKTSPFRRPRALQGMIAKPRQPATEEQYLQLFRAGSRALKAALFFLRETGARTCEMREALWSDITLDDRPCIVLFTHKTARKTGKCRVIALNAVVHRFLLWLKRSSRSPYIFTNCEGGSWNRHSFAKHLRRTAQRIGLDDDASERVTAYCLRHTYTCAALTAGFTSKEVADQLGHTSTQMVERVYGSTTGKNISYLNRIADDIRRRRA